MNRHKDIYTTGQVARICNVAPRTVTKWFDSGKLRGYRIPGGRDRRIPAVELLRFMKTHNLPIEQLELDQLRILIIDSTAVTDRLLQELKKIDTYDVQIAKSNFDAGLIVQKFLPNIVLINLSASNIDADNICKNIRTNDDLPGTKIIAIASSITAEQASAIIAKGYDQCAGNDWGISEIIAKIDRAVSLVH
ncbi:MAG: helix-turn-helix domain-containing protein [Anaerohalosphaeraceae bacterium]|nr:helix-turn-helix domain-containing protein [Anaerohalosphaeraceae bacterium]